MRGTILLIAAAGRLVAMPASAAVIHANNSPLDDTFTNPTGVNQGLAVGSSGWYYNNARNNGVVGVQSSAPCASNGSVYFRSPSGSAKADVEYFAKAVSIGDNYLAGALAGCVFEPREFLLFLVPEQHKHRGVPPASGVARVAGCRGQSDGHRRPGAGWCSTGSITAARLL